MVLYALFRVLCWLTLPIYYKRFRVSGKPHSIHHGPLIVVSNHPNTMMDALVVGTHQKQRLGFLANAGIFSSPLASRIWRSLQVIPIYRKQDLPPGQRMDNHDAFKACFEFLARKKSLMILPEGSSYSEMKLRKIRSGTARIALEFQARHGVEAGLKILPVSLNYSEPFKFRSKLLKAYHAPIELAGYAEDYKANPSRTTRRLTEDIRAALASQMVILDDKEREQVFRHLRVLHSDWLKGTADGSKHSLSPMEEIQRHQGLAKQVQSLADEQPEDFQAFKESAENYFHLLDRRHLRDGFFKRPEKARGLEAGGIALALLLGSPLFLAGFLICGLPFFLTRFLTPKLAQHQVYHAVIRLMLSWILFFFWFLIIGISGSLIFSLSGWWILALFLGGPVLGGLAWAWYQGALRLCALLSFLRLGKAKSEIQNSRQQVMHLVQKWFPALA